MSVTFSTSLVKRYQEYMHRQNGLNITLEQANRDLQRLADLYALFSPTEVGGFTVPVRTAPEGGYGKADRRED